MTRVYLRDEVRAIPIRARRPLGGVVQGDAQTRLRGAQGLEFSDFREYEPGDDVSRIDWNVTARLGKPWVRMYLEERGHPVLILADVSSSTLWGRGELAARKVIADIAARLASAAIWSGCETGLLLFTDRVKKYVPAKTGLPHLTALIRELKSPVEGDGRTDVTCALNFVQTIRQRRGIVFLLSDFLSNDFADSLRRCAQRHEVVAIGVGAAESEEETPDCGLLNLRDPESGEVRQIDTSSREVRQAFGDAIGKRREANAETFRKAGVDYLPLAAAPGYMNPVIGFLRQRVG